MKVLHLPTSVAGQAFAISEGERSLGIESDYLLMFKDDIHYPEVPYMFDYPPESLSDSFKYIPKLIKKYCEIKMSDYDILHFNFSRSLWDYPGLFDMVDLTFGYSQKIFVTFNGCDGRVRSYTDEYSPCSSPSCFNRVCKDKDFDVVKTKRIAKWDKYSSGMFVATPDLLRGLPERTQYIPNTMYGWNVIKPVDHKEHEKFTIVHAPSNRWIKGTDIIIRVVDKLQRKCPDKIRLILVENMTRKQALEMYQLADLAIDQIKLGWYGVFSIECMKMGIPVMAYANLYDKNEIPKQMADDLDKSLINVNPDTLEYVLEEILYKPSILDGYRECGMEFAEKWHSPSYVSKLTKSAYENALRGD